MPIAAAALTLGLAGCSSGTEVQQSDGDDQSQVAAADQTPTPTEDPEAPSEEDFDTLWAALGPGEIADLEAAQSVVKKGSVAEAYVGYQLAAANARVDGGQFFVGDGTSTKTDDGYEWCEQQSECVTWSDIEVDGGKVTNFTVNGQVIDDRLVSGNGKPQRLGALGSIELLYAYKAVSDGDVVVLAKVESANQPIDLNAAYLAQYRDPSGRQLTASAATAPASPLGPNSSSTIGMYFPDPAKVGGTVTINFQDGNFDPVPVQLTLK